MNNSTTKASKRAPSSSAVTSMQKAEEHGGSNSRKKAMSSSPRASSSSPSPSSSSSSSPNVGEGRRGSIPAVVKTPSPAISPNSSPIAGTTPRKAQGAFTIQYCSGSVTGRNNRTPIVTTLSPSSSSNSFSDDPSAKVKTPRSAFRRLVSFRPDLDMSKQRATVQNENLVKRTRFLDREARRSTFIVEDPFEDREDECEQLMRTSDEQKKREAEREARRPEVLASTVKDLKYRLKGLVTFSMWHQAELQAKKKKKEEAARAAESASTPRSEHSSSPGSVAPQDTPKRNRKQSLRDTQTASYVSVGSRDFTQLLLTDIEVMFEHCMKSPDVPSPEEGAAIAYRHTIDQLSKVRLWEPVSPPTPTSNEK